MSESYFDAVTQLVAVDPTDRSQSAINARQMHVNDAAEAAQAARFGGSAREHAGGEVPSYRQAVARLVEIDPTDRSAEAIELRRSAVAGLSRAARTLRSK